MKNKNFQNAFSLMEMMVVLLIVAIIAAATAPMVTKKMMRTAGSGDSPWVFTGLNNNIAYNMAGANASVIIGATNYSYSGNQPKYPRLVLAANGANHPALVFAGADGAYGGQINMDPGHSIVTMNDQTVGKKSVAFGYGQSIGAKNVGVVAIGEGVTCGEYSAAVGQGATCGRYSTAVGTDAKASGTYDVAIANTASASGGTSIAIGYDSKSTETNSIAIGHGANAAHSTSIAIGYDAKTSHEHQIVLGTVNDTVYIPGHLVAQDIVATRGLYFVDTISGDNRGLQLLDQWRHPDGKYCAGVQRAVTAPSWLRGYTLSGVSDRRLKNVGEKYTAGLEELKKLDFYHYTFKADKDNTPLVGVMAQDLQKVFPDAVTKGEDGYLRIRLEDMFYAVINAVKELDAKVSQIVADVTGISSKVDEQQKVIEAQQQKIDELEKANADFEKRLAKLEKKNKKFEE